MEIKVRIKENIVILSLLKTGCFRTDLAFIVTECVREGFKRFLADFERAGNVINHHELVMILEACKFIKEHGGVLKFANVSRPLARIFAALQIDREIKVYPGTGQAMRSFGKRAGVRGPKKLCISYKGKRLCDPLLSPPGPNSNVLKGIYNKEESGYFELIKNRLFSGKKDIVLLVPAGGTDIVSPLFLNATQVLIPDLAILDIPKKIQRIPLFLARQHFDTKRKFTWNLHVDFRDMLLNFIEFELKRLGVKKWSLETISGKKHVHRLSFYWAYPGEGKPRLRIFTFVGGCDLRSLKEWGIRVREWQRYILGDVKMFDGIFLKAQAYMYGENNRYLPAYFTVVTPILPYCAHNAIAVSDMPLIDASPLGRIREIKDSFIKRYELRFRPKFGYSIGAYLYSLNPAQ